MVSMTERVTEYLNPITKISPASHTTEQNSTRIDMSLYRRVLIVLQVGALATNATLDLDVEQHTAASGGSTKNVTGKSITQLTEAGGDSNKMVAVELRAEELDLENDYRYISVELTPATAAAICGVIVLATVARYEPVSTSAWDEIVD